jgi:hypothetical protein
MLHVLRALEETMIEALGVLNVKGPPKKARFDKVVDLADRIDDKLKQL